MSNSFRWLFAGALCTALAAAGFCAETTPQVVDTYYPAPDIVIASRVVAPLAPEADASQAIQHAIDSVAEAGGGVVFLPAERFTIARPIVVKETVTLRGERPPADLNASGEDLLVRGTLLAVTCGRGKLDGQPAVTIERGAGVRDLSVWYPEQSPVDIVPYPWTFRTSTSVNGNNSTLMNVTLVNAYQGFKTGPEHNELHTVRNVSGTVLKTGVWVDSTTDIGRIINVNFGSKWWERSGLPGSPVDTSGRTALRKHLLEQATGVDMGRSDWEYLYGLQVNGYAVGFNLRKGERGTTNAVMFRCMLEDCATGLMIDRLNGIGLACTGCRFSGRDAAVHALATFDTVSQFNTCEFGRDNKNAKPDSLVILEGSGLLTFQNCRFGASAKAGIEALAGALSLLACEFAEGYAEDACHVHLAPDVTRARLLGNRFASAPKVLNGAEQADVMVSHRPIESKVPDTSGPPPFVYPRPTESRLYVVTDYGASPDGEDNTKAFNDALAAAGQTGGTVYIPGGYYRFAGALSVPSGVELRGCFDVPHHTVSGGSVLMVTGGRGDVDGTPFLSLEAGSGLRGLTIWYPEQDLGAVEAYPWAVRAMGAECWVVDVALGNCYQGVDMWTHPSDGHIVQYLCGAVLRRGLFVSKCDGPGWVEDIQFNPHYGLRLPADLPRPQHAGNAFEAIIDQQRGKLEAMVFGRCREEHLTRNFLYAAYDGLAFRDDEGAANARVIMHGTDTGSRALVLDAAGPKGIDFINTQLVPLGKYEVGALIVGRSFAGRAALHTTQMWAGSCSGIIEGTGDVLIQQLNTISGGFTVRGGTCAIENAHFARSLHPHVNQEAGCAGLELIANICADGPFVVNAAKPEALRAVGGGTSLRPKPIEGAAEFATGWEEGDPPTLASTIAGEGGSHKSVENPACAPSPEAARTGDAGLRVSGDAAADEHACAYFRLLDGPFAVRHDSVLSYWFRPVNESGRRVALDILFDDGATLRDSGMRTVRGESLHPGTPRGTVGEWKQITIPFGRRMHGKRVKVLMAAYDNSAGGGHFEADIDDVRIALAASGPAYEVRAQPRGGQFDAPAPVSFDVPEGVQVRYTLDGSNPEADSPLFAGEPIRIGPGLHELRYAAQQGDGVSQLVFGELYDVK